MSETDSVGSRKACVEVEEISSAAVSADSPVTIPIAVPGSDPENVSFSEPQPQHPVLKEVEEIVTPLPKIIETNELSPVIGDEDETKPDPAAEKECLLPEDATETESSHEKRDEIISTIAVETESEKVSDEVVEKECLTVSVDSTTSSKNGGDVDVEKGKESKIEITENEGTKEDEDQTIIANEECTPTTAVISTVLNLTSPTPVCNSNDLVSLASDKVEQGNEERNKDDVNDCEDDSEDVEDDQIESETNQGTCSRSRPYIRRPSRTNLAEISSSSISTSTLSHKVMPTPPDDIEYDKDADDICKNKISHLTPATPPIINLLANGARVVNPLESSKTEQCAFSSNKRPNTTTLRPGISTNSVQTDSHLTTHPNSTPSRDQSGESVRANCGFGRDSSSGVSETSSQVPVLENPATSPVPPVQIQPSSTSSVDGIDVDVGGTLDKTLSSHAHLVQISHDHDHKDKRLLVSMSPAGAKSGSGQSHHSGSVTKPAAPSSTITSSGKKGSKIPIGIAVAWQRLVTSNSSLANNSSLVTTTVSSSPSPNKIIGAEMPKQSQHSHHHHKEKGGLAHKAPIRPSSASPIHISHGRDHSTSGHKIRDPDPSSHSKGGSYPVKRGSCGSVAVGGSSGGGGQSAKRPLLETSGKSVTPELMGNLGSIRPLPSSSVPPNLGLYNFHHQPQLSSGSPSMLEYHYSNMRSLTPFPQNSQHSGHHQHFTSLPPTWQAAAAAAAVGSHHHLGLGLGSDLSVPQGYPTSAGAYIQQTMQNQLQFQHHLAQQYLAYSNPGGGSGSTHHQPQPQPHYLSPTSSTSSSSIVGYESSLRHHYEALLQHQQQSEYLRHFHHQQQQQNHLGHQLLAAGMYSSNDGLRNTPITFPPTPNTRIPLLSPSPTGVGVRTPTPNSGFSSNSNSSLSLSNLSALSPAGQSSSTVVTTTSASYSALHGGGWPVELFMHQNSSAALSPKSLTSSSPSPVTVQGNHHPNQEFGGVNTIAGGGSGNNTTTTFVGGKKTSSPSPKLRRSFPLKDVWEDKETETGKDLQVKKKHLSMSWDKGVDERREPETDGGENLTVRNRHLNLHPITPLSSPGSGSESKTSSSKYNPDTERDLWKKRDEKEESRQHVLEVSHPHPPPQIYSGTKPFGPSGTKHDFKRLDSLIEKRDSSREEDERNGIKDSVSVSVSDEGKIDKNFDAMTSSCNQSVINEGEKVEKVEDVNVKVETVLDSTPLKIMDLKQRVAAATFTEESSPSLSQLGEKVETDLNQNLKSPLPLPLPPPLPVTTTLPDSLPVTKVSPIKKTPKVKAVKGEEMVTPKQTNKRQETPKKPRKTPKEKSLDLPNENQLKEKAPPKSKKSKKKDPNQQVVVPGKTGAVKVTKKKPCKIKPDTNVNNYKQHNPSANNEEPLELVKHPKPKVYKSKKTKEQEENNRRLSSSATSCDPLPLQTVRGMSKENGNKVPELNLPVATTSEKVMTLSTSSKDSFNRDNNSFKCKESVGTIKVGLSPLSSVSGGVDTVSSKIIKKQRASSSIPKKVREVSPNKSPNRRPKGDDPKREKVKKVKAEKVPKTLKKEPRRKPVAIKSKGTEPTVTSASTSTSTSSATTTVILPSISFPNSTCASGTSGVGGQITGFSPMMTISSPNPGESSVQNSPMIPISLPYHNSPVTLILPRILPQPPTLSNSHSHQQTSFKLVVSSQEIKIPAFVPSQAGVLQSTTIEGTSQLQTFQLHHHQQNFQNMSNPTTATPLSIQQNIRSATSSSVLLSSATGNPCDSDNLVGCSGTNRIVGGTSENTITFIRDTPMSHPTQNGHFIEGLTRQAQPSQSSACYLSPPALTSPPGVPVRKDFIPSAENNHLNLLATVAQEFGSRDDLGKLAQSNSSRGSSLMTSPILSAVQSPELNFLTPSSTVSSCASTSISLPSSPLNTKFNSKSPHRDEYEYDEKEGVGGGGSGGSGPPPGSYKHSVWLKIPTIVPTAGKDGGMAKKRRKPQQKQATTEKTDGESSPKKKKTNKKFEVTRANENTPGMKNEAPKPKLIKIRRKSESFGSKLKIPKPKKEKQLSPKKKQNPVDGNKGEPMKIIKQELSPVQSHPFSIKMTLPVPKVEKIRIKLSDSSNPTLMDKNRQKSENKKLLTNGASVQQKIKRRHSEGGDKLNKLGKKKQTNYSSPNTTKVSKDNKNYPLKHKEMSKPKNYNDHDNNNLSLSPSKEQKSSIRKSKNKPISVNTVPAPTQLAPNSSHSIKERKTEPLSSSSSIGDLFLSSFSSLTPPPTAKSVGVSGGIGSNLSSAHSNPRTPSIFSPSSFETDNKKSEQQQTQNPAMSMMIMPTSLTANGGGGESGVTQTKLNWVADPTFAASAIRGGMTSNNMAGGGQNVIKTEKVLPPFAGLSSDEDEDQALMEYERRTAERMRNEHAKSGMFGLGQVQQRGEAGDNKSLPKSFVPYHKRTNLNRSSQQQQHPIKIKPCLKAEPRPRSGSSEDENSDAEIDFEVASLTNSIPRSHSSMLQQYRNSGKVNETTSGGGGEPKPTTTVIKNVTSHDHQRGHNKRRLSTTGSNGQQHHGFSRSPHKTPTKHVVGRRLSLNLETGRTHAIDDDDESEDSEEELLDIGNDYSTAYNNNRNRRQSTDVKNDKKQTQPGRYHPDLSSKHRRFSGGSASTSASFGSTLPKTLPKKRGTRSLTTSSRSSVSSGVAAALGGVSISLSRSSRSGGRRESTITNNSNSGGGTVPDVHMEETLLPGKIELGSVDELKDEMRILTEIQGLFYTGKLKALQPPDVYGVTLDNERGAPPHLIFSAEEVLEKCVREKKPQTLTVGIRICAYWSPQYSGLYSGRVSTDFNLSGFDPEKDLIPIEFDDGDTGMIKLAEIRLLPSNHPTREYDPNPLLTLEKKHRKRRHSSTNTSAGQCTGDHDEPDCGESYCAKVAKMDDEESAENGDDDDDDEEEERRNKFHQKYGKSLYWTWTGLGYKRSKAKKSRNKEFFKGIQRGDEVINVGDSAIFISHGNERPYIGRIEKFWEKKGQKIVNVRWFYHPQEVKSPKRIPHLKHTGALFESPHIDENDVQTIAKKCDVLPYTEFKERIGRLPIPKMSMKNSNTSSKPKDLYYVAGFYDPYTYNLQVKI